MKLATGREYALPQRTPAAQRYLEATFTIEHLAWLAGRRYNGILRARENALNDIITKAWRIPTFPRNDVD